VHPCLKFCRFRVSAVVQQFVNISYRFFHLCLVINFACNMMIMHQVKKVYFIGRCGSQCVDMYGLTKGLQTQAK
jgi:hypothetical protein